MLNRVNFDFCKEVGLMKENFSHQYALDTIKESVRKNMSTDPKFKDAVDRITLDSLEVSVRVCVLYEYKVDLIYVLNGQLQSKKIHKFGSSGVNDSLHIGEFKDEGKYTVVNDVTTVKYSIYNDKNLFTLEGMKSALASAVDDYLPRSVTDWQSKNWEVSAYLVPTLIVCLKFNNKNYFLQYNLHNGYHTWQYPNDPALLKRGKKAYRLSKLLRFASFALNIAAFVFGIVGATSGSELGGFAIISSIVLFIVQLIVTKKTKKSVNEYQTLFLKNPFKSLAKALIPLFVFAGISLIIFLIAIA